MIVPNLNSRKAVIVKIFPEEKENTTIHGPKGDITLFLGVESSQDGRWSQPTTGVLVAVGKNHPKEIPIGSYLCFHHNAIIESQKIEEQWEEKQMLTIQKEETKNCYRILWEQVYFYVEPGGEELNPVYPFAIGKRIKIPAQTLKSGIISRPFDEVIKDRILIENLPSTKEDHGIETGKVYVMIPKSDYELNFKQGGTMKQVIRINLEEDLIALDEELTEKYKNNLLS